jgi:Tfp pilus assembly protein PilN
MDEVVKTHLNLLPQSYRRRRLIRRRVWQWSAIGSLWLLAAGGVYGMKSRQLEKQQAQRTALEMEYAPVEKQAAEIAAIRSQIEQLQQREGLTLKLADEQPVLAVLGVVSRAASSCNGDVCVQRLSLTRVVPAQQATGNADASAAPSHRALTLTGIGVDNLAVARFAASLGDAEVFETVNLKSAWQQTRGDAMARSYLVECAF